MKDFSKENIIDKWLKENGNPEIEKQVENEYKEIMKETAMALVEKYKFSLRGFTLGNYESNQCAKLDLTNRIEMLENLPSGILISQKDTPYYVELITNLKQQLEYLNNL